MAPPTEQGSTSKITPTDEEIAAAAAAAAAAAIKRGADDDIEIVISNKKANEEAIARLQTTRERIDSVIKEPTFWEQVVIHKVLIVTILLTLLGMVGSILGLVTGYVAEKDRGGYVLAGAILSLVGNFVSSATGVFVTPPTLGKKTT